MKSEIRIRKNGKLDKHYFVPVFFDLENLAYEVKIENEEKIEVHCGEGWKNTCESMDFRDYLNRIIGEALSEKFEPKTEHFIRGTNNKIEVEIAKRGELQTSINYRDNIKEIGISVAIDYSYIINGEYDYAYFLDGEIIGYGSDGEPLLNPKNIKVIGKMMKRERMMENYHKKRLEERNKNLKECRWSVDAFIKLTVAFSRSFTYEFIKEN